MTFLTDFADPAVVLPLSLVAAAMLGLMGWRPGAFLWLLTVGASLGIMVVLKVAVFDCGPTCIGNLVRSPSGHTASAALVYGGLAGLVARSRGAHLAASFLPAPVVAFLIGFSRIALGVHTLLDVLIGGAVGCAGALAMLILAGTPPPRLSLPPVLAPVIALVIVMHGYHFHAEGVLNTIAIRYAWLAPFCAPR
ncbi:MAG: phosphatase PAP2 family protein [Bradyrhizobium sp.]